MKKEALKAYGLRTLFVALFYSMLSCSSSKTNYDQGYAEAWKKVLKSQAWKDALANDESPSSIETTAFYSSTEDSGIIYEENTTRLVADIAFGDKYDFLVSRAYIKIIAEAEKADTRLEKEYIIRNAVGLRTEKKEDKKFKQDLELVNRRYHAHRKMLDGLKSWNIFSEYGTDDLDFFKAENQKNVLKMVQNGKSDSAIINYLIYKLADLYHFEG